MKTKVSLVHLPRPPYHHGDLARALLKATDEIIEEDGLEAFTLRSCARRAGVSHAAPAHHFKDRAGLLSAYAACIFRDLTAFVEEHVKQAGTDSYAQLQAVGLAYIRFALQRPSAFSLIFRCESLDKNVAELKDASDACFQVLIDIVQALMPDANKETVLLRSMLAWSTVHGFATLWLEGNFAKVYTNKNIEPMCYADTLAQQILQSIKPAFVQP
jgi:AcrR family transcriptional regulator